MRWLSRTEVKLFLTFFIVFLTFMNVWDWNEKTILATSASLAYDNKLYIDNYLGDRNFRTGNRVLVDGHYYTDKGPGLIMLAYPVAKIFSFFADTQGTSFWVFAFLITALTSSLLTTLTCILVYRTLKRIDIKEHLLVPLTVLYGFGTLAFIYATNLKIHATSTFFLFLAFYILLFKGDEKSGKMLLLSGSALGFSIITEYAIIIAVPFFIFLIFGMYDWKKFVYFFSAVGLVFSFLLVSNIIIYNDALTAPYSAVDPELYNLNNVTHIERATLAGAITSMSDPLSLKQMGFETPSSLIVSSKFLRYLFFPYSGVFFFSPVLLLAIIGAILAPRNFRILCYSILFLFLTFIFFYSVSNAVVCRTGYGCRFFVPVIPFLMIPIGLFVNGLQRNIAWLITIPSIIITSFGLTRFEILITAYGSFTSRVLFNVGCLFKPIANPLFDYYIPLFLAYGPQSYVVSNILGIGSMNRLGITTGTVPFLNVGIILVILAIIWRKELLGLDKKKLLALGLVPVIIFVLIFSSYVAMQDHAADKLREFETDSTCIGSNPILPESLQQTIREDLQFFDRKYSRIPIIPASLSIDPLLPLTLVHSAGWKRPTAITEAMHGAYNGSTITINNPTDKEVRAAILIEHIGPNYREDSSFTISLNGKELSDVKTYGNVWMIENILIGLKPGNNTISFEGVENCDDLGRCEIAIFSRFMILNEDLLNTFFYQDGWLPQGPTYLSKRKVFMQNNATISFNSENEDEHTLVLRGRAYGRNRTLRVLVNDKIYIRNKSLTTGAMKDNVFRISFTSRKGKNVLRLLSNEPCDIITYEGRPQCIIYETALANNKVLLV